MSPYLTHNRGFKYRNVTFLLGAGASYDHGYPLVSEFLSRKYLRWLCDQCAGLPAGDGDSAKMLAYALRETDAFLKVSDNFEEVLTDAYEDPAAYQRVLEYTLWILATAWNVVHSSDLMTTADYLGLAIMLLDLCRDGECSIITFNYDTAVEDAISSASRILRTQGVSPKHLQFNYGLQTKVLNLVPEHFLNFGASVLPDGYPNGLVTILKLHGSINTKICEHCTAVHYGPFEGQSKAWSNSFFNTCRSCERSPLKLLLVPPGKRKQLPASFEELWQAAEHKLDASELVIIAGYSIPAYDVEARSLLAATLRNKDVLLIDPYPNADATSFLSASVKSRLQVLREPTTAFLTREANAYNPTIIQGLSEHCKPRYLNPENLQGHPRA